MNVWQTFFGNNGACTGCPTGYTNDAGDNQVCTTCSCDPPVATSGTSSVDASKGEITLESTVTLAGDSTVVGNGATIKAKTGTRAIQVGNHKLVMKNITIEGGKRILINM